MQSQMCLLLWALDGGRESSSELGCAVAKRVSEAAFGIWAVRGDDGDLECFHHPSKGLPYMNIRNYNWTRGVVERQSKIVIS